MWVQHTYFRGVSKKIYSHREEGLLEIDSASCKKEKKKEEGWKEGVEGKRKEEKKSQ